VTSYREMEVREMDEFFMPQQLRQLAVSIVV
jgi:hypothetical protein